jgi:hypothetical protein
MSLEKVSSTLERLVSEKLRFLSQMDGGTSLLEILEGFPMKLEYILVNHSQNRPHMGARGEKLLIL